MKRSVGILLVAFAALVALPRHVDATEVAVTASGEVADNLLDANRIEVRREQEFRLERPQRGTSARQINRLRARAGRTVWMNESFFEKAEDLSIEGMVQKLALKHAPTGVVRLEIEMQEIMIPNASLAALRGPNFWMRGTIRELDDTGQVVRKERVDAYLPYRNVQNVPYRGDGYIVQQGEYGTPAVTLAAYWTLEALERLYPEEDIPTLWTARNNF